MKKNLGADTNEIESGTETESPKASTTGRKSDHEGENSLSVSVMSKAFLGRSGQ